MIHIIIGLLVIALAIWSMLPDWMFIVEVLKVLACIGLVVFGIVAVLAGVRRLGATKPKAA